MDFNRDGVPDLVVGTWIYGLGLQHQVGDILVLLGHGDGTFLGSSNASSVAGKPLGVADFNLDGFPDVAVVVNGGGAGTDTVRFYMSRTDGYLELNSEINFGPQESACGCGNFGIISIVDFNMDGIPDVVLSASDSLIVMALGDGSGGFVTVTNSLALRQPDCTSHTVAVGDFNLDGHMDLVVGLNGGAGVLLATDVFKACWITCGGLGGGCVDPQNDWNNCSRCGNACVGGQTCASGVCTQWFGGSCVLN